MKDRIQLQRIQLQNVWPCCWLSVSISWRAVHSSFVAAQVAPILKDEYHGYHAVWMLFFLIHKHHFWSHLVMTSDTTNILAWNKVKWCIYSLNWHFQVLFSSWSFLRSVFGSMQRICIMHNTRLCTKSNSAALQYCIRIINELIWIFLMLNTTWDFNKRFVFSTVFRVYCWMFHFFGLLLFHVPWMKQRSKCFDDVMSKWLQRLLLPLVIVVEGFPLFLRSATRFTPRAEAEVTIISYAHC